VKGLLAALMVLSVLSSADAASLEEQAVGLRDRAEKMDLNRPEVEISPEIQQRVDRLISLYRSPEYQRKLRREQARIREILGLEGQSEADRGDGGHGKPFGRSVYVFVSSSVPLQTLRNYAADMAALEGYDAVMVFRGFVGGAGKIGPTARLIGDVLKVDSSCDLSVSQCDAWPVSVTVDPEKFRRFGIRQVPAITLDREGKEPLTVYGDVSLEYALRKMGR